MDMLLRDYFIAHAPATPPEWFAPVMPTACPEALSPKQIEDKQVRHDVNFSIASHTQPETEEGRRFLVDMKAAEARIKAWTIERSRQQSLQWPVYWADQMLIARGQS